MAGTRFFCAGAILYAFVYLRTGERPTREHWRNTLILGLLLLLCGNGGVVWAEQTVPSGLTALLVATVPLWLVVLDWLRPHGNRPSLGVILGIIVGLAGVVYLVGWRSILGQTGAGNINPWSALLLIFSALTWSAGSLFGRKAVLPSPLLTTAMEMLTGGTALLVAGLSTGEGQALHGHSISIVSLTALLYLITFGSLLAYTAYTWIMLHASPATVGTYAYVNPVVAVFLGWLIAKEPVTRHTIVGAAIIIAAIVIITTANAATANVPRETNRTAG